MLCCTRYFETPFHWVDGAIKSGGGVLVHCLAGAHRAGTVRAPTTASQLITNRDHLCTRDKRRRSENLTKPCSLVTDVSVLLCDAFGPLRRSE